MGKRNKKQRQSAIGYVRENKGPVVTYIVLRVLVILVMVAEILGKRYNNVFLCLLTLVLFLLPSFIGGKFNIHLPNTLEIIILLFIFSAEILGEISSYYITYPFWDTMLHTLNGFLMAAIGLSLIDILNRSDKVAINMSPLFVGLFAFCFSMTIGIFWEFFEYFADAFLNLDMQKDTIIQAVNSTFFNPAGTSHPAKVAIESIVVNGKAWNFGGYIDIGLIDTMADLIVNFIGAFVFSAIGVVYIKNRGRGNFAKRFIPTLKKGTKHANKENKAE